MNLKADILHFIHNKRLTLTDQLDNSTDKPKFSPWEGSSVFVNQGTHWSSAFIWLSSALFGTALVFAFTAKIDQTVSVRGTLEPYGSVKDVEAPTSGIVLDVFVKDGQFVSSGTPLLTVQAKGLSSQLSVVRERLLLLKVEKDSSKLSLIVNPLNTQSIATNSCCRQSRSYS